jgi:predicted nucleotidyltransferase
MLIRTIKSSPVAKKRLVKRVSKAASLIKGKATAKKFSHKQTLGAMGAARSVANFLREHGARHVFVFGSVAKGTYLRGSSDIDLFFEGVPPSKESLVAGRALLAFPDLHLDLRPAGFCERHFREEIKEFGMAI